MQIKLDVKSIILGLILGIFVFLAMGQIYDGSGRADFGFAVDTRSFAVLRDNAGIVYVLDPQRARVEIVEYNNGPLKGRAMDLDRVIPELQK